MATKRRKVLLRRDDGGMAHFPAWTVVSWPAETTPVITFLERLPGDVVLSREDVADIIELVAALARESRPDSLAATWVPAKVKHVLLRGRR